MIDRTSQLWAKCDADRGVIVITGMQKIHECVKEEEGLVAAEYAILLGMIAVALLAAVTTFSNAIGNALGSAGNTLSS